MWYLFLLKKPRWIYLLDYLDKIEIDQLALSFLSEWALSTNSYYIITSDPSFLALIWTKNNTTELRTSPFVIKKM